MPRLARNVFAGVPHHITQRGNRREDVFFCDEDRRYYLKWLQEYSERAEVEILAYCLMTNHLHIVAIPKYAESLAEMFRPLHMRYAQYINRQRNWKGHLWQGRFFSSGLDETYLWAAIRYVEQNPVRANIVRKAERYAWSSAVGNCGIKDDPVLSQTKWWQNRRSQIEDWSEWLSVKEDLEKQKVLNLHVDKNLPCGTKQFVRKLEKLMGRPLGYRKQGRPNLSGKNKGLRPL